MTKEVFDLQESEFSVEEESGRMFAKIRILKAGLSKNNRNYRPEALRKAAKEGIFDGIRMFVNHSKEPPLKRPLTDMVSAVESTSFDEADKSLNGRVEFFNEDFYKYANRAKKYMGTSIDAIVLGDRIPQRGGRVLEDIYGFHQPKSVDWVLFPAAGGEILAFESEGEEVDWESITEEDIKKNLPTLWAKWHPENHGQPGVHGATEGEEGEENGEPKKNKKLISQEQIEEIVTARLTAYEKEKAETLKKQETAAEQVRAAFATAGLPEKTRARLVAAHEGETEYDEAKVKQEIIEAKEELKAAGARPQITDMGPSGGTPGDKTATKPTFSVNESVQRLFGKKEPTAAAAANDSSKKEN
jgi:hypothetical protein